MIAHFQKIRRSIRLPLLLAGLVLTESCPTVVAQVDPPRHGETQQAIAAKELAGGWRGKKSGIQILMSVDGGDLKLRQAYQFQTLEQFPTDEGPVRRVLNRTHVEDLSFECVEDAPAGCIHLDMKPGKLRLGRISRAPDGSFRLDLVEYKDFKAVQGLELKRDDNVSILPPGSREGRSGRGRGARPPAEDLRTEPPTENPYPISLLGRTLGPDGKPIAGAKVYLASLDGDEKRLAETITDAGGKYQFSKVPLPLVVSPMVGNNPPRTAPTQGHFQVFAQADGQGFAWRPSKCFWPHGDMWIGLDGPMGFGAADEIELNLKFAKPARLAGRILDARGQPLANASVSIRNAERIPVGGYISRADFRPLRDDFEALSRGELVPSTMKQRKADASGRFEFAALPSDCRFSIEVRATGFANRLLWAATQDGVTDGEGKPVHVDGMEIRLPE